MPYKFPRIKFADTNTIKQQLDHIQSELVEVFKAYNDGMLGEMDMELCDLGQSVETLQRMREERNGVSTKMTQEAMVEKNRERGYYSEEESNC